MEWLIEFNYTTNLLGMVLLLGLGFCIGAIVAIQGEWT